MLRNIKKMDYYKLRITLIDNITFDDCVKVVKKYSNTWLGCYELGKKEGHPHTHWYLETDKNRETIVKEIRKLGGKGNRIYSMTRLDEEKPLQYLAYCIKDADFTSEGLSAHLIQSAKEYDAKVKIEMKEKKAKSKSTYKQLCAIIEESRSGVHSYFDKEENVTKTICKRWIVELVLKFYQDNDKILTKSYIINLCQTLCYKYVPSYDREYATDIILKL